MAKKDGNIANLIVPTSEQARINGRKGGLKSQQVQKQKKTLKEIILTCMEMPANVFNAPEEIQKIAKQYNRDMSVADAMTIAQVLKSINGDTTAFTVLRDTAGQKPMEEIKVSGDVSKVANDIGEYVNANGKSKKHD